MDRFDRSFQRAQYAYDNMMPPEGPEGCECEEHCCCEEENEARREAAEEARAEQRIEDAIFNHDREEW